SGERVARALDVIVRQSNAQVQLIDDLLDVSRMITGKMRLDVRPVDLKGVVEQALDRSEEHTSELQSLRQLVCRLLLEKKKVKHPTHLHVRTGRNTSVTYNVNVPAINDTFCSSDGTSLTCGFSTARTPSRD